MVFGNESWGAGREQEGERKNDGELKKKRTEGKEKQVGERGGTESLRRGGEGAKKQKRTSLHSLSIRVVIGQQPDTRGCAGVHACCGADCAYTLDRTRHCAIAFIAPFTRYPGISLLSSVLHSLSTVIHTLFSIDMTLYRSLCHFSFPQLESFPFPLFPFLFNSIIRPPRVKLKKDLTVAVLQQLLNFAQTTTELKICGH